MGARFAAMPLQFSKRLCRANFIAGKTLCVRKSEVV
jgi:hypothetical protein